MQLTNEQKLAQLSPFPELVERHKKLVDAAELVINAHPEYGADVAKTLGNWVDYDLESSLIAVNKMNAALHAPDVKTSKELSAKMRSEHLAYKDEMDRKWIQDVIKDSNIQGVRAIEQVKREVNPGMVGGLTQLVYNENKGGLQFGGLIGLVGGGLLGLMGGGEMGGGWWSIIATIGGALLGAWIGNKGGDMVSNTFGKDKKADWKTLDEARGKAQELEKKPSALEALEAERAQRPKDQTVSEATRILKARQELERTADAQAAAVFTRSAVDMAAQNPAIDMGRLKSLLQTRLPANALESVNVDGSGMLLSPSSSPTLSKPRTK